MNYRGNNPHRYPCYQNCLGGDCCGRLCLSLCTGFYILFPPQGASLISGQKLCQKFCQLIEDDSWRRANLTIHHTTLVKRKVEKRGSGRKVRLGKTGGIKGAGIRRLLWTLISSRWDVLCDKCSITLLSGPVKHITDSSTSSGELLRLPWLPGF